MFLSQDRAMHSVARVKKDKDNIEIKVHNIKYEDSPHDQQTIYETYKYRFIIWLFKQQRNSYDNYTEYSEKAKVKFLHPEPLI